jgi:hypothetical protein
VTTAADHKVFCLEAAAQYLAERDAANDALDWRAARWEARKLLVGLLLASDNLQGISQALTASGTHMIALRHLLAPPISQDQFKLLCKPWSKATEKSGKPVKPIAAAAIAAIFDQRRDRALTPWLDKSRAPTKAERRDLVGAIEPLIASQRVQTARRNRLALRQEQKAMDVLVQRGWKQVPAHAITVGGAVDAFQFMHKAKFASGKKQSQEIDLACGLGKQNILAVECKVTNDETNSIKRMNDVLKKATSWKNHWGSFVKPAAILEGNIKFADVQRLLDENVEVFWSHRLDLFGDWLQANLA